MSALWAHHGLKARGLSPLELVMAETLTRDVRWEHRLRSDCVSIDITLSDGRKIRGDTVCGVLNRLIWVPSEHLLQVHPDDREYINVELIAFFASWLNALPQPVLNRPTPQGLSGRWRAVSEWTWLASKAELPTLDYRLSSREYVDNMDFKTRVVSDGTPVKTVIVVEGHVIGAPTPMDIREGCRRLAELARTELIGVEFFKGPEDPWTFVGATTSPDLRLGGDALLDVLASVLKGEPEGNV